MEEGDGQAAEELYSRIYADLRRMAQGQMRGQEGGHTLQPTALVNEAFVRLWQLPHFQARDREHFLAVAARAMRSVLVDHARSRTALKRGGADTTHSIDAGLDDTLRIFEERSIDMLAFNSVLERLAERNERQARIVELRFFAGMTTAEASRAVGISEPTADRDWRLARIWLREALAP